MEVCRIADDYQQEEARAEAAEEALAALKEDNARLQRNLDTAQSALCGASHALSEGDAQKAHGWLTRQEAYKLAVAWKRELEQTIDRLRDECAQRKKSQRDAAEWLERKSRELHEQAPAFPNLATALGMLGLSLGQDPLSKETREKMEACRAACPEEADSTKTATTEEKQHGA
jgi:hypothetical protein